MSDFFAIDFETYYAAHETVCAVGLVRVSDGAVVNKFYSLIKPPSGEWAGRPLTGIHGITEDMLCNAPTFLEVFPIILQLSGNATPVAHNASTERNCILKCCRYYGIEPPQWVWAFEDTYTITRLKLTECCRRFGIDIEDHHDPLRDAMMCARVFMAIQNTPLKKVEVHENGFPFKHPTGPKVNAADRIPLPPCELKVGDCAFVGKHVLYTGTFEWFPNRCDIGACLKRMGAIVDRDFTRATEILIIGKDPGPKKLSRAQSQGIEVVSEQSFYIHLKNCKDDDPVLEHILNHCLNG